ncbi:replication initiation protein [Bacillus wiedmannii]|uniref:replication initiation protein n=1 Tax=Bacillus wiedmannii TaxID=1890302 RepID=UPI000BEF2C09|nr:replication initiation protein [Bacillus wiedmannii]PEJ56355.1 initiator RepB protein [Bacillus wiedmannii]
MSVTQKLQIKEHNIISKSNILIEANSRLNLLEQKILLCLASNIEPTDRDFKTYTFPIRQFHKLLVLKGSTKYTELSKITKDLLSKVVEIRTKEDLVQVSWISSAVYNKNKGTIDIRFDPLLKPFLLELSNKFTSYRLANVIKLKSTYSIRIYELLKQYEDIKERTINLDDLRYYLNAIHVYPQYANFKQRVLKSSQKELKKTDISFEFEEIKLGRKVQKIRFVIRSKKQKDEGEKAFKKDFDSFRFSNTFEGKIRIFEERCNQKIFPKVLKRWEKYSEEVLEIMDNIRFRTDIESPIAYVDRMLRNYLEKTRKSDNTIAVGLMDTLQKDIRIEEILKYVVDKYSNSTGAIATFLVKDTFISYALETTSLADAEKIWGKYEDYLMGKIYQQIKKNRNRKKTIKTFY